MLKLKKELIIKYVGEADKAIVESIFGDIPDRAC
jgi:hypothetical protein